MAHRHHTMQKVGIFWLAGAAWLIGSLEPTMGPCFTVQQSSRHMWFVSQHNSLQGTCDLFHSATVLKAHAICFTAQQSSGTCDLFHSTTVLKAHVIRFTAQQSSRHMWFVPQHNSPQGTCDLSYSTTVLKAHVICSTAQPTVLKTHMICFTAQQSSRHMWRDWLHSTRVIKAHVIWFWWSNQGTLWSLFTRDLSFIRIVNIVSWF